MSTAAIHFDSVKKRFGDFSALNGLSLEVQQGELYGLIGPNGAGKTTAIRILTGLTKLSGGTAKVLGLAPQDPKLRSQIGYMPQETALYQDLTVGENLRFFGSLYTIGHAELERRIEDLLQFVDLTKWRDTVITNLSGGMRHRTSLAVALLSKPRLLILDEPTVGVDPELRATFWQRFADMRREGTTILITTHYMDEAMRCEKVGLVNHGILIAEGKPTELLQQTRKSTLEDAFLALAGRKNDQ